MEGTCGPAHTHGSHPDCSVCANPRNPHLSVGQIRWHNAGHAPPERFTKTVAVDPSSQQSGLGSVIIVRRGDRVYLEIARGRWQEISIASLLETSKSGPESQICKRCHRTVLGKQERGLTSKARFKIKSLTEILRHWFGGQI